MSTVLIWLIAIGAIAGILLRPRIFRTEPWPEAAWAGIGAILLVITGLLPPSQAVSAVKKGTDVYLFLTGMMLLAELGRREGLFDWLASHAVAAAKGSPARLFALIYLVGIAVTVFLSNDATAVVLTPAVCAAVRRARASALPYLLICAFIANAASFVLPISNPANLVVYGSQLPPLLSWLRTFAIPSVCSIVATYFALRWKVRANLAAPVEDSGESVGLSAEGRLAAWGTLATGAILIGASAFGLDLGLPTCAAAIVATVIATKASRHSLIEIAKNISWSVLPLVAGLFVIVEALNRAGAQHDLAAALQWCATLPPLIATQAASFGIAALSNLMNNLPSGLLAGAAMQSVHVPSHTRDAVLIGVDLGPNLSVAGSLATILWLIALRREGERIDGWQFLKIGLIVMPPALLLATLAISIAQ